MVMGVMMSRFKKVSMGVTDEQREDIRFIQKALDLPNDASAVATAVCITRVLISRVNNGGRLFVDNADGTRQELRLPR